MSIEISHVTKRFGNFVALDDIALDIPTGELVALLGPSGCGKTTLLRIIAGLESADGGQVLLDGADIPFLHLVTEIDPADVRMGMRVQAVWKPREEWGLGIDNIDYFKPTGEPDADYDSYKHHL